MFLYVFFNNYFTRGCLGVAACLTVNRRLYIRLPLEGINYFHFQKLLGKRATLVALTLGSIYLPKRDTACQQGR